jgi:hypothetical protein
MLSTCAGDHNPCYFVLDPTTSLSLSIRHETNIRAAIGNRAAIALADQTSAA